MPDPYYMNIAGPNGSGKSSTFEWQPAGEFGNAGVIEAPSPDGFSPTARKLRAGKMVVGRLYQLIEANRIWFSRATGI
ncbi:putative ABC-type ATPase [Rhizobium sp. BK313]|nr:putative ABC-type ATPase [Rhizobium sp. BK313]